MTTKKRHPKSGGAQSQLNAANKVIDQIKAAIDALDQDSQQAKDSLDSALRDATILAAALGKQESNATPQKCSLFDVAEQVFTQAKSLAEPKQLSLIHDIEPDEQTVLADTDRLHKLLFMLIINSIEHADSGYVKVSAMKNRSQMHISVIDTGKQMNDAQWATLLDTPGTFGAHDHETARSWVRAQAGDIWTSQHYNGGNILSFTLPIDDSAADKKQINPRPTNPKILVVDDDPINRMVLQGILRKHYDLNEACDGLEAIQTTLDWRPNLVLMDVMMPRMSGYDACEEIRKIYDKERLPILFITAKRPEDEARELERSGGSAMLTKPIDKDALLSTIQQYMPNV